VLYYVRDTCACYTQHIPNSRNGKPSRQSRSSGSAEPADVVGSVHLFQSHNYKLGVSIGLTRAVLFPVRSVLDTGAGPNLVREDVLPSGWDCSLIPNQPLPQITNASGKRMPVKGVIILILQVGNLVRRVRFYVTPGLGVPCILGCNFINLHVRSIHPKERRIDLIEGVSCHFYGGWCVPNTRE
jgi:hypothetical protein